MLLQVFLGATLRRMFPDYDPVRGLQVSVEDGATVGDLAHVLGLSLEEIKVVMVDGRHGTLETILHGDERVALFPAVGGG